MHSSDKAWGRWKTLAFWGFVSILTLVLTLVTQIGGIAFLAAVLLARFFPGRKRTRAALVLASSLALYTVLSLWVVPPLARAHGRIALPCSQQAEAGLAALTPMTCILNRHYVTPDTVGVLTELADHLDESFPGISVRYLDGGFPFGFGFPMLPHLSHGDGRKVDLAFFYRDQEGRYVPGLAPSPIGYWGFESPPDEYLEFCPDDSVYSLRWDMTLLQPLFGGAELDTPRTRGMLSWLAGQGKFSGVTRILLEPHLKQSLNLQSDTIRFQGCRAARHDDHVHVEVSR